ncbi:type II toxin-antitoxin system RatA family toxin [Nitrosomonas communis]|uniref:type II toxin-antitoxin system RatA family toxin n=1 Tax=Nitrosomonas communis TaxID=44574 RepID=UPI003D2B9F5B
MGTIRGERTVEIEAPVARCFDIAADIEGAPAWQGSLVEVAVLERDGDGRPALVETVNDAKVRRIRTRVRFRYEPPVAIDWVQERGDVKALAGWWRLEALDGGRTRATYGLEVDPGRVLGLLVRGPVVDQVREHLLGRASQGLKEQAESG